MLPEQRGPWVVRAQDELQKAVENKAGGSLARVYAGADDHHLLALNQMRNSVAT